MKDNVLASTKTPLGKIQLLVGNTIKVMPNPKYQGTDKCKIGFMSSDQAHTVYVAMVNDLLQEVIYREQVGLLRKGKPLDEYLEEIQKPIQGN